MSKPPAPGSRNNPEQPDPDEHLALLADAYLHGELSPDGLADLESLIQDDPAAAARFIAYTQQASMMREVFNNVTDQLVAVEDQEAVDFLSILSELDVPEGELPAPIDLTAELARREMDAKEKDREARRLSAQRSGDAEVYRPVVIPKTVVWLAAAAAIGFVASVVWLNQPAKSTVPATPPTAEREATPQTTLVGPIQVATITGALDAMLADGRAVTPGMPIYVAPFDLVQGIVQLELTSGVTLTLEGPAYMDPGTDMFVSLDYGKLVGQVPEPAHGFVVRTPTMDIVDLGTEFGIEVEGSGRCEVHVLDGLVQVEQGVGVHPFEPIVAEAGRAFELSTTSHAPEPIALAENLFYRTVPGPYERMVRDAKPLAYWRFTELNERGDIEGAGLADATLSGVAVSHFNQSTPTISEPGDQSLWLDPGQHHILTEQSIGLDELRGFTVEAWVWVPRDADGYMRVVANNSRTVGAEAHGGFGFGVSGWAKDRVGGPVLMVTRFGVFDAYSTQAVPTEQWVHVAVVFDGPDSFVMFINGRPQPFRIYDKSDLAVTRGEEQLRIGGISLSRRRSSFEAWHGGIDELAIYGRALDADEIAAHASFDVNEVPR